MGSFTGVLTQVVIVVGTIVVTLLGAMFTRRKSQADVEVTLSTEARQWVVEFKESARMSAQTSAEANERARHAEAQVRICEERINTMERYIRQLVQVMDAHGIQPPIAPVGVNGVER